MRWRKSWLSIARMECMAKVIDGSGAVGQAKMHACNGKNIADHNFTIDKLPSNAVCLAPEIYPGSTLYGEEIYGQLPAGLSVRPPTPCSWSIRSTVDLNKLHFDVPKNRSTDVHVNGDTLNLLESAAFKFWTSGRKGAPVACWMLQKMRRTRSRSIVGWSKVATKSLPSCRCTMDLMMRIILF